MLFLIVIFLKRRIIGACWIKTVISLKKGAVALCFSANLKEGVTNACSS